MRTTGILNELFFRCDVLTVLNFQHGLEEYRKEEQAKNFLKRETAFLAKRFNANILISQRKSALIHE